MEGEGMATVITKAEIDTSAPFRSVKEAVVLFGERVLCTEVYATTNRKEIQRDDDNGYMTSGDELEATKQSLQTTLENSMKIVSSLASLQQELQQTKMELQQMKIRESDLERQRMWDSDSNTEDDVKFVEEEETEFQKKKCVRFANSPTIIAEVMVPKEEAVLQRHSSLKKTKKLKQIIPLIRGLFSNKRGRSQVAFA